MRIIQEPAFILHSRFYKETSLLLDVFSRHFGRLSALAKGARRPQSQWRGRLLAFQPLELSLSGKGELKVLTQLEWQAGIPLLAQEALCCAFYVNELLRLLLPVADAHESLFDDYYALLLRLASQKQQEDVLRCFELSLLKHLGYSPFWGRDSNDLSINQAEHYFYHIASGTLLPVHLSPNEGILISGKTLLDLTQNCFDSPVTKREAKQLMRAIFDFHLNGKTLMSREIFREMLRR